MEFSQATSLQVQGKSSVACNSWVHFDRLRVIAGDHSVVNLSVMRLDRKLAFDVNTSGVYSAIMAAVHEGHDRFINTGAVSGSFRARSRGRLSTLSFTLG